MDKSIITKILTLFLPLLVASCSASPTYTASKQPETGQALVYLYWLPETTSASFTPTLIINDKSYLNIVNGKYIYAYLNEGTYRIGLQYGLKKLSGTFGFSSGKTYYVKVSGERRPVGLPYTLFNFKMAVIASDTGSREIKNTSLIGELVQ